MLKDHAQLFGSADFQATCVKRKNKLRDAQVTIACLKLPQVVLISEIETQSQVSIKCLMFALARHHSAVIVNVHVAVKSNLAIDLNRKHVKIDKTKRCRKNIEFQSDPFA